MKSAVIIKTISAVAVGTIWLAASTGQTQSEWPKCVRTPTGVYVETHRIFDFSAKLSTNQPVMPSSHVPAKRPVLLRVFSITDTNIPAGLFQVAFYADDGEICRGSRTFPLLTKLQQGEIYRLTVDATSVSKDGVLMGELRAISTSKPAPDRK
jgi:hypothetical protein